MPMRIARVLLVQVAIAGLISSVAFAQDRGQGGRGGAAGGGRAGRGGGIVTLAVTSTSFADGAEMPAKYAGAQGVSPQLSWSGAPAEAMSYVLIMHDVDAAIPAGSLHNDISH